jgi:hypothetical protein
MSHEFDDRSAVHVHRDIQSVARDLLHIEEPYISTAGTPQLAAREYLDKFGPLLGITHEQLDHLWLAPEAAPIDARVEYRFLDEKVQFDTIVLVFSRKPSRDILASPRSRAASRPARCASTVCGSSSTAMTRPGANRAENRRLSTLAKASPCRFHRYLSQ